MTTAGPWQRRTEAGRADQRLRVGELEVDLGARKARLAGKEIMLRTKEFELLARLVRAPGVAVGRITLMADVWDSNWYGSTKTLDVHIAALRKKLGGGGGTDRGDGAGDRDAAGARVPVGAAERRDVLSGDHAACLVLSNPWTAVPERPAVLPASGSASRGQVGRARWAGPG